MNDIKIKFFMIFICIILICIIISGCIFQKENIPQQPDINPRKPSIDVDSIGNIHIVWDVGLGFPTHFRYLKLDANGNKLTPIKEINGYNPKIIVDKNDNIQIFYGKSSDLHLTKFDNNGNILIKDKKLVIKNITIPVGNKGITIDSNNKIHMIFGSNDNKIKYIILNEIGEIINEFELKISILNPRHFHLDIDNNNIIHTMFTEYNYSENNIIYYSIGYFKIFNNTVSNKINITNQLKYYKFDFNQNVIGDGIVVDIRNNVYVFLEEYNINESQILFSPMKVYYEKYTFNGSAIKTKLIPTQKIAVLLKNSNDEILIFGTKGLSVINSNETIINFPIYLKKEISFYDIDHPNFKGVLFDNNKIHLVWYKIKEIFWEDNHNMDAYFYYTIYYSKIDSNGTTLINKTIIDTDGDPDFKVQQEESQICLNIIFIAIPISLFILILFYKLFRNQQKSIKKEDKIKNKNQ